MADLLVLFCVFMDVHSVLVHKHVRKEVGHPVTLTSLLFELSSPRACAAFVRYPGNRQCSYNPLSRFTDEIERQLARDEEFGFKPSNAKTTFLPFNCALQIASVVLRGYHPRTLRSAIKSVYRAH